MKKQDQKKSKLWLAIVAIVAVIGVAVGAVLLAFGGGEEQTSATQPTQTQATEPQQQEMKLYYNVERKDYQSQDRVRSANSEGMYRMRFAVDGEQVDLMAVDRAVMQKIDAMDVMGLVFNTDGYIVDAIHIDEFTGGFAVKGYYVTAVEGNKITTNASGTGTGLPKVIMLNENTKVYNAEGTGITVGIPDEIRYDDLITAIEDEEGNILVCYVEHVKPVGDVLWNVERLWNSTTKTSTREPDETGLYTFNFILKGEPITLYTRNAELAEKADVTSRFINVEYDEQNFITAVNPFRTATGGGSFGLGYRVTEYDEKTGKVVATNADGSITGTAYLTEDCVVMDCTSFAEPYGGLTKLQVGDTIYSCKNSRGKLCYIFIIAGRTLDAKVYWNVDRDWNKTTLTTNRRPGADGYYRFRMAVDGQHTYVRTNDLTIAEFIEKNVCSALKMDGDIVVGAYSASAATGGSVFASWYEVTGLDSEGNMTAYRKDQNKTVTGKLAADCEIFNVSDSATMEGERTSSVKVGDTVHCFKDNNGEVILAYVVTRPFTGPIYWNVDKQYDSANKVSTREPAADGYYYITLAVKGEHITVKTKNKEFVDSIDAKTCMSLHLSGDVVTKVLTAVSTLRTKGGLFATNYNVIDIVGNKVIASNGTKTVEAYYMADCEFYNVSKGATLVGEKTKLKVGDKINGLLNSDKKLTVVYILETLNHTAHTCDCCGKDVTWTSWDGVAQMQDGGHYCLGYDANVWIRTDANATVTICLNGKNLNGNSRVFNPINAGVTINVVDCGDAHVHGKSGQNASIGIVNGGTLNIYGGTYTGVPVADADKAGGLLTVTNGGTLNIYDGVISGGQATSYGGNINVVGGELNIYGGTIENGTAATFGGNISANNTTSYVNIYGGTVTGGTVGTYGSNIAVPNGALSISGGTIENGTVSFSASGTLTLGGKPQIERLELDGGKTADASTITGGAVGFTASVSGPAITGITQEQADLFTFLGSGTAEYVANGQTGDLVVTVSHSHCRCVGADTVPDGHTCEEVIWEPITGTTTISESGNYYLGWTGGKAAAITLESGVEVNLCLNGAQIYAGNTITIADGCKVTICDCGNSGVITVSSVSGYSPIRLNKAATVVLMSGTIRGVANNNNKQCVTLTNADAKFYMYGGTLADGYAKTATDGTAGNGGNLQVSIGSAYLYGGTMTGGTADKKGQNVYVGSQGSLTVGGTVQLGDVYLSAGRVIAVDASLQNASIGVELAAAGTVATGLTEEQAEYFTVKNGVKTWSDNTLTAVLRHVHCTCVNAETKPADHTCDSSQVWKDVVPVSYAITLSEDGYYYFGWTGSKAATVTVKSGVTAHVCMNGATMAGTQPIKLESGAKLVLCDCTGSGAVYGSASSKDSLLKLVNDCELVLMSGNLLGGSANRDIAAISVTNAGATVKVYGGTLGGGATTGNGGAIDLQKGTAVLMGGSVTDGAATLGKSVYVGAEGSITVGGTVRCGEIYLTKGKTLTVDPTLDTNEASLTVTLEVISDPIATGLTQDISGCITSGNGGYEVKFDTDKLILQAAGHVHCLCKGSQAKPLDHVCKEGQTWSALTANTALVDGGHYYLDGPWTSQLAVPANCEIYLCLNGQQWTYSTNRVIQDLEAGMKLHICDCSGVYDEVTQTYSYASQVTGGYVSQNATICQVWSGELSIYGGNFVGAALTASNKNGGMFTVRTAGVLNLYGGWIHGGSSTGYGGNINVSDATFRMYGGKVSDGTSAVSKYAGNIAVSNGAGLFELYGGVIENGTAGSHGGNIGIGNGSFVMYGGTLKGGSAGTNGGAISVYNSGTATILGGTVEAGTAVNSGNCIYSNASGVTVGNTAQVADVFLASGAKLNLSTSSALTGSALIGVSRADTDTAIADTDTDVSDAFQSTDTTFQVIFDELEKVLKLAPVEE